MPIVYSRGGDYKHVLRRRGVGRRLFLSGREGIGADAVSGCYFAIGAIFEFCKDFYGYGLDRS